jgi:adenosylcobinamide-phosphate synthase
VSYAFHLPAPLILAALLIDVAAGDPAWIPHPVRLIGAAIDFGERRMRTGDAQRDEVRGAILAVAVIAIASAGAATLIGLANMIGGAAGAIVAVAIAWTTLALRGLDDAAGEVQRALGGNDDARARRAIPALAGRDPDALDRAGMIRAAVESVAENSSDGVIAPLLYLFVGGSAAAIAYKAINTLDSMIGYRDERYLHFGHAAARIDDAANYIPARLTALCIIAATHLTTHRGRAALQVCRTDARRHHSPNAGFPEAAIAGAMDLRLGGDAVYAGVTEARATLGESAREPAIGDIAAARALMWWAAGIAFILVALARMIVVRVLR